MRSIAHGLAVLPLLAISLPAMAGKVTICHRTGSGSVLTLEVASAAVSAHLGHGDSFPTSWYTDADGDGYGDDATAVVACTAPTGTVGVGGDEDDSDPSVYPGATDVCDSVDNDSDGSVDEDALSGAVLMARIGTTLTEVAPSTGDAAEISTLSSSEVGVTGINALTSDLVSGETYGMERVTDQLVRVDVCSGAVEVVGPLGYTNACGLSFGPGGSLYAIDSAVDELIRVNPLTGDGTSIGSLGFDLRNCGMAYDCATDTLYGVSIGGTGKNWIFTIDPGTGVASKILQLDPSVSWSQAGLEVDVADDLYYVSMATGIYAVDAVTGLATQLHAASDVDNLSWWAGVCE